jgi:glycosyltransferase involved in cell wall biosynthesis
LNYVCELTNHLFGFIFRIMSLKISIITVCKNRDKYLQETINSVAQQTFKNIEYIIIDGGSTDKTIQIIEANADKIHYWISEPDKGMYFAINKGLSVATGDYILILNSDDILVDNNVIFNVVNEINKDKLDYYHGNIIKWRDGNEKRKRLFRTNFKQLLLSKHGTFVPHPCFFISKSLNETLGGYDLTYKYASDFDYILRALKESKRGRHLKIFITKFRIHPETISSAGYIDKDRFKILNQHGYLNYLFLTRIVYFIILWGYYKLRN